QVDFARDMAEAGGADEAFFNAVPETEKVAAAEAPMLVATESMPPLEDGRDKAGASPAAAPRVRKFFPETLLWNPQLITDDKGTAKLELALADSITTWRLSGSAVSPNGALGSMTRGITVFQDFFIDIDFPVALTQHDEVSVPVAVFNYLDQSQTVRLTVEQQDWFELLDEAEKQVEIAAGGVTKVPFRVRALKPGRQTLTVKGLGSSLSDAVQRSVLVRPDGEEVTQTVNGRLSENDVHTIEIPEGAINGANDLFVKVYPGAFSQVMEGMDSIFRMPYGCFEQTSSSTYPNILVLDYLRRTKMAKPDIEMKALNFINIGYQRLLSYEVNGGGFEWFGKTPAHNVLTAYGLMEFYDMSKVHDVDPELIKRTRQWLLNGQQGDGSWKPTGGGIAEGAINAYQGKQLRTTAYIAWALAETGSMDDNRAFDFIRSNLKDGTDAYTLAMCANAYLAAGREAEAGDLLNRLVKLKQEEKDLVWWSSEATGVMHARGRTMEIETTSLIAYALLKSSSNIGVAHKALSWLISVKDPRGTWHSTQATVLAMRALLAGADANAVDVERMLVTVTANGALVKELEITEENSDVFHLISLRDQVRNGENRIALETAGKGSLAFQIVARHYMPWPGSEIVPIDDEEPLKIDLDYDTTRLAPDDVMTCTVKLRYNRPGVADMTLVDLGIPPGFSVMREDFEALKKRNFIERYSVTGRQVTLYFRQIPGGKDVQFTWRLKAKFPVKAKTPVTVAYQYYEPEVRAEAAPVELVVE
ncbi:MAG: alpha-2-macroglobulin family protein, partial [Verrucomicrobiota bacterium]